MMFKTLFLFAMVVGIPSTFADDAGCDLNCKHGSTCVSGAADFSTHFGNDVTWVNDVQSPGGYHCKCTEHWTGLECDIHFKQCGDENTVHEHTCYNSASCVVDGTAKDGEKRYGCDCTTVESDIKFVGAHCGHKQTSAQCVESTEEVEGASWFCVNGGSCGDPKETDIEKKCDCGKDFVGPHCEFPAGEMPECTLACENGGQCNFGIKDMTVYHPVNAPFLDDKHYDFMHCVCPEGFTGVTCDIPVTKCHKDFCFHGATCHKSKHTDTDEDLSFCDCSTATSMDGNLIYAGKSCEYAHKKSDVCPVSLSDDTSPPFCLNGGSCKAIDNARSTDGVCDCIDGFTGPKCEYSPDTAPPKCDLDCFNGGECRTGVKDFGGIKAFDDLPFVNKTHVNFQYCACPDGYTGLKCEIEISECGADDDEHDHICLNGSTCQQRTATDGTEYNFCDCTQANTAEFSYAGAYCQHIQTQICHNDDGAPGDQFCSNGGRCKEIGKKGNKHMGCDCDDTNYTGDHCEIPTESKTTVGAGATATTSSGKKGMSTAGAFFLSLFIIGAAFGGAFFARKELLKRDEKDIVHAHSEDPEVHTADAISDTTSQPTNGDGKPEDSEMHNVEII